MCWKSWFESATCGFIGGNKLSAEGEPHNVIFEYLPQIEDDEAAKACTEIVCWLAFSCMDHRHTISSAVVQRLAGYKCYNYRTVNYMVYSPTIV
jgi:hypothetical protein